LRLGVKDTDFTRRFSVIAVHDLNNHAYGSWVSRQLGKMWIQDMLAVGIDNVRFMTYGYDISTIKAQNPIRRQAEALADAVITARAVNSVSCQALRGHCKK